jgi:hypothetical protein
MKNVKCEQKDEEIVGVSSQDEECEDVTSDIQVFLLTMLNICKKTDKHKHVNDKVTPLFYIFGICALMKLTLF